MSPTADLRPTGSPVAPASSSTQSSRLSTSLNSACRDGLTQSTPSGAQRAAVVAPGNSAGGSARPTPARARLGGPRRRGQHPAQPRLGALAELDLHRPHRGTGDEVAQPLQVEAAVLAAAAAGGGGPPGAQL